MVKSYTLTIQGSQIMEATKTDVIINPTAENVALAGMALDCQDACNGVAILNSATRLLLAVFQSSDAISPPDDSRREESHGIGTSGAIQHQALLLIVDKIQSLQRMPQSIPWDIYTQATQACEDLRNGLAVNWTFPG